MRPSLAVVLALAGCGEVKQSDVDAPPTPVDSPIGVDAPSPDAPLPTKLTVFVTSTDFDGAIGGLASADNRCTGLATGAGLAGTYKAWLTDQVATNAPAARFTRGTVPYVLPDGTAIANDFNDLISGSLRHAIDQTETGAAIVSLPGGCDVWTGTSNLGAKSTLLMGSQGQNDHTCNSWTSVQQAFGMVAGSMSLLSSWSESCGGDFGVCTQRKRLYCFQQ